MRGWVHLTVRIHASHAWYTSSILVPTTKTRKRLTDETVNRFLFSFFCCNPKIVSIFAPAMAKCIFYILLGLFLISKFTSVSDDMEGCKTLPTADVHYFSGTRYSLSGADGRQCQEKGEDANYNCLADAGCIGNTFSLRHASCSKLLRLNPDFIAAKVARTLKTLLPEEKTTSFPFTFHPHKISYRYYVYTLRRILI